MDKKTLIENLAREAHEKGGFNGAWLYAENGEIISTGAIGWRDAENTLPVQVDTIFEMASISKMFTATAVMLLRREGKLSLDDEYTKFFPEYPYKGVTIRHLLTHTSGMPEDFDTENWVAPIWNNEKRIPACSEILDFIIASGEEADCAPGERFEYTDIGYCLIANAVEKVSGVKFEEFLKKNVFEPAGMKDSAICHTRRDGRPSDRFARNMVLDDGKYVPSDVSEQSAGYVVGSDGLNGCDYLYTTVSDMLAWDRALREEKVLTLEEQKIVFTPFVLNNGENAGADEDDGYGLGWFVKTDPELGLIVNHSGGMPGLATWFERFVDADRVIAFMNCRDYADVRAYVGFESGLEAIARDKEPDPVVSIEDIAIKNPDKSDWENFLGKYERPDEDAEFVIDELFMEDGELHANAIAYGDEVSFRLYPLGENKFCRKQGYLELTIGENCLKYDDFTCKKR
ncbi:MAG: beta-lactamase family protein [Clostridia bacterium]|nr:beta-lactamase family protein [Clostridia bacterium]